MSEGAAGRIDFYEPNRLTKALVKLSAGAQVQCRFGLGVAGYSWVEQKLELYLLSIGSHENFYREAKAKRKTDLKLMK